ncbi:ABC transporter substrate-binding protein (plasmid) [Paracoccus methylovorus]|uniref:ABC transporter substrate-binding protein n=1 Tax=Paracoccus methylovorus TaxID=2812658 RepID=A0ABX7JRX0_9RHOB|nr:MULTISPECIES: ABC transporter substrate-binding protein [Paracoccus]QRZ16216.1 ABC transporter substrate-binding protein [Paracoccus methylovorus]
MRALILVLALILPAIARAEIVLTDAAGREVRLDRPARNIATNDSLLLLSLALLEPDPVATVAGWGGPQRLDAGLKAAVRARFPAVDDVPEIAGVTPASTSVEPIIAAAPDLFVVTLWDPGWQPLAERLEAAGIPVLFLENSEDHRIDRVTSSARALHLLGRAMGREDRADAFADFASARMEAIRQAVPADAPRPKVLVEGHAAGPCCAVPGRDNMLAQMVALAGGESFGSGGIAGYDGRVAPETLMIDGPAIYVATGGAHLAGAGGFVIGAGIPPQDAQQSLEQVLAGSIRRNIPAVAEGRAHGVSHQLSISALNVVVTECLARWIHPEIFAHLDPQDTLDRINTDFLAVPLSGSFCIDAP